MSTINVPGLDMDRIKREVAALVKKQEEDFLKTVTKASAHWITPLFWSKKEKLEKRQQVEEYAKTFKVSIDDATKVIISPFLTWDDIGIAYDMIDASISDHVLNPDGHLAAAAEKVLVLQFEEHFENTCKSVLGKTARKIIAKGIEAMEKELKGS